jgi:hypothetical protein
LQLALQVIVNAKMCTDALSVSYPPGAQVKRVQGVHEEESALMQRFRVTARRKTDAGRAWLSTRHQDGKKTCQDRRQGGRVGVGQHGG